LWISVGRVGRASTKLRDDSYIRNHVLPTFGRAPLGEITQPDVRAWIEKLVKKGLAPNTVKQCYRLLAATMAAAVDARLIRESPCRNISLPRPTDREQRFLTPEEVRRLADTIAPPFRTLVLSAAYLGCRWGELVGLKRTRLNLLHATVEIVGTLEEVGGAPPRYVEATKTVNSRRKLSVPPFLVDELQDHLSEASPSDLVFTTVEGQLLRRNNFRRRYWLPAVDEAGLAPLRFHDLRHTCASLLIAQGRMRKRSRSVSATPRSSRP
jgi:integrase